MAILLHVIIAIVSILFSGSVFLFPSRGKFYVSYVFIAGTIVSGTFLIITMPAHMVQSCMTGLIYLGVVSTLTVFAHKKLAAQERSDEQHG